MDKIIHGGQINTIAGISFCFCNEALKEHSKSEQP